MLKKDLVKQLGGTALKAAEALGYKNKSSIDMLGKEISADKMKIIIDRAEKRGINILIPDYSVKP